EFDAWIPLGLAATPSRGTHPLRVFARLAPSTSLREAQAEMDVLAGNLARAFPEDDKDRRIAVRPLFRQVTGDAAPALRLLLAAVGFVLVIACANVANLLLARGAARQHQVAVRLALGASRARVAWQLFVESALLALAGGVVGLIVAALLVRAAIPYLPAD